MSKLCSKCGSILAAEAKFCGKCGAKVVIASSGAFPQDATMIEQSINQASGDANDKLQNQLGKLVKALWYSIGLTALSGVIRFFDVCEYYSCGRFGIFIGLAGDIALSIWLTVAISGRKNWARVTFIANTLLMCALQYKFFSTDGNGFCLFLDCVALVIDLYCVIQLFTNKMAQYFMKLKDGVKRAKTFWGVFIGYVVVFLASGIYYQVTNENDYINACAEAAARGSEDAYKELITYGEEHEGTSRSDIDAFIESKRPKEEKSRKSGSSHIPAGPALYWGGKAIAKVISVAGVLICGIGAWLKKTFIDGSGSK